MGKEVKYLALGHTVEEPRIEPLKRQDVFSTSASCTNGDLMLRAQTAILDHFRNSVKEDRAARQKVAKDSLVRKNKYLTYLSYCNLGISTRAKLVS